jgi:hypothetical protein
LLFLPRLDSNAEDYQIILFFYWAGIYVFFIFFTVARVDIDNFKNSGGTGMSFLIFFITPFVGGCGEHEFIGLKDSVNGVVDSFVLLPEAKGYKDNMDIPLFHGPVNGLRR